MFFSSFLSSSFLFTIILHLLLSPLCFHLEWKRIYIQKVHTTSLSNECISALEKVFIVVQVYYSELYVQKLHKLHNKNLLEGNFNIS